MGTEAPGTVRTRHPGLRGLRHGQSHPRTYTSGTVQGLNGIIHTLVHELNEESRGQAAVFKL
jgi:hypothetical protein